MKSSLLWLAAFSLILSCQSQRESSLRSDNPVSASSGLQKNTQTAGFGPLKDYPTGPGLPFNSALIRFADVDGDGKQDFILLDGPTGIKVAKGQSHGIGPLQEYPASSNLSLNSDLVQFGDIDGDGKADLIFLSGPTGIKVAKAQANRYGPLQDYPTNTPLLFNAALIRFADIDSDGKVDIILLDGNTGIKVAKGLAKGFGPLQETPSNTPLSFDASLIRFADIDGDRKADLVLLDGSTGIKVAKGHAKGFGPLVEYPSSARFSFNAGMIQIADVDGDGKADFILLEGPTGIMVATAGPAGYGPLQEYPTSPGLSFNPSLIRFADVDGDGKDDFVLLDGPTGIKVAKAQAKGYGPLQEYRTSSSLSFNADLIQFADVDGDRKADFILLDGSTGVKVAKAQVNGFGPLEAYLVSSSPSFDAAIVRFADVDGDGKADLVLLDGPTGVKVAKGQTKGFGPLQEYATSAPLSFNADLIRLANIDGDGKADFVVLDGSTGVRVAKAQAKSFGPLEEYPASERLAFNSDLVRFADVDGDRLQDFVLLSGPTGIQVAKAMSGQ